MTYQQALDYLESFINYERRDDYDYNRSFKLDRMKRLAYFLGDPQDRVKAIHVAGSKGKGSTCAFIQSVLKESGLKVGLYTSPHLVSFRERIRIGDSLISEEELGSIMDIVKAAVDRLGDNKPSFFEVCTAVCFMYFERNNADLAVYEVGLGGRLDATNIIKPLVCAITPISYEHTHLLGDTLGRIAFEKAGIIKSGVTCVSAPQEEDALCSIRKACEDKNAKLVLVGDDIKFKEIRAGDDREVFDVTTKIDKYLKLETSILGHHQMVNAAAAIGVVEALRPHGYIIDQKDIRIGVKNAKWSGRLEVIQRHPYVILDGAHNSASADTLASAVRKGFKYSRLRLVLGVSKDKDVKGILEALIPISDLTVITKSKIAERAFHPEKIKEMIADKEAVTTSNVKEALNHAIKNSDPDDLILVTGSLFVVGEAREIFMGKK